MDKCPYYIPGLTRRTKVVNAFKADEAINMFLDEAPKGRCRQAVYVRPIGHDLIMLIYDEYKTDGPNTTRPAFQQ